MTEYIKRDEAVKKAIDACIKVVGHGITQFDAVDIAEAIESITIADVVEVKHGVWVDCRCSVCKQISPTLHLDFENEYKIRKTPYCPNCGAKMDGKNGDACG